MGDPSTPVLTRHSRGFAGWRRTLAAAVAFLAFGAGNAGATPVESYWFVRCIGVEDLPRPPVGRWVQAVELCGVKADALALAYIPDQYCFCWAFYTPHAVVQYGSIYLLVTVDGVQARVPVVNLPPNAVGTPGAICVYTNDPFHSYPCLL